MNLELIVANIFERWTIEEFYSQVYSGKGNLWMGDPVKDLILDVEGQVPPIKTNPLHK